MATTALNTYKKVGLESKVHSATPAELIELLFEGAIKAISAAHAAMTTGDVAETGRLLKKATVIVIDGLKGGLSVEKGGAVATTLAQFYDSIEHMLMKAQLHKKPDDLLEAKRLLLHSEVNVAEIAAMLSFDDPAYFSRCFRKHTGRSPIDYRRSLDKLHI